MSFGVYPKDGRQLLETAGTWTPCVFNSTHPQLPRLHPKVCKRMVQSQQKQPKTTLFYICLGSTVHLKGRYFTKKQFYIYIAYRAIILHTFGVQAVQVLDACDYVVASKFHAGGIFRRLIHKNLWGCRGDVPRPLNVSLLTALWSLLEGIWGLLKGSWGVLV